MESNKVSREQIETFYYSQSYYYRHQLWFAVRKISGYFVDVKEYVWRFKVMACQAGIDPRYADVKQL